MTVEVRVVTTPTTLVTVLRRDIPLNRLRVVSEGVEDGPCWSDVKGWTERRYTGTLTRDRFPYTHPHYSL